MTRLTNVSLGPSGSGHRPGCSLVEALREEEEELGFDHDVHQIVVSTPSARKEASAQESDPLLDVGSSTVRPPSGLTASTSESGIPPGPSRRTIASPSEDTPERIYSSPWLRCMTQLSRDVAANLVVILTMLISPLWALMLGIDWLFSKISVILNMTPFAFAWLYSKIPVILTRILVELWSLVSWCGYFYVKISVLALPVVIVIALADLVMRS